MAHFVTVHIEDDGIYDVYNYYTDASNWFSGEFSYNNRGSVYKVTII